MAGGGGDDHKSCNQIAISMHTELCSTTLKILVDKIFYLSSRFGVQGSTVLIKMSE